MAESEGNGLWAVLGEVPDSRSHHGRRFDLRSMLAIVIGALLCGRTTPASIARWGRKLKAEQLKQLGIDRPQAPCQSTYHYVLKALRVDALEKALGSWVARTGRAGHVCLDGKTLRASRRGPYPALHVLALYSESLKGVIAQMPVGEGHNEISVAMKLLKEVELEGAILSGDAEFTQRAICQEVTDRGGDYFVVVKDNQSALKEQISTAFAEPFSPLGEADVGSGGLRCSQP
jgi:hypothetical protein